MTATSPAVNIVEGRLTEKGDGKIVLSLPHTDYQLHLAVRGEIAAEVGSLVRGVIELQARRVDVVPAGGRYVEPVYGRPRRVQGAIVGGDLQKNQLYVSAGPAITVNLMPAQQAKDFARGQMVSFDAEPGATFELVEA